MDERRIKPRWQITQGAELTVENGVHAIPCIVEDISPGGMCLSLRRNLFDDAFSSFKLVLGINFEFHAGAQVAWRDQTPERNFYGLSFNRIDDAVRSRIGEYVKENFPNVLVKQWWKDA